MTRQTKQPPSSPKPRGFLPNHFLDQVELSFAGCVDDDGNVSCAGGQVGTSRAPLPDAEESLLFLPLGLAMSATTNCSHRQIGLKSLAAAVALVALGVTGCTSEYAGQSLPSGYYLTDDVQYFAPGAEFKLAREAAALEEQKAAQKSRMQP